MQGKGFAFAAGVAAFLLAGSVQAQDKARLNIANAYPASLSLIGEAGPKLVERVKRASGGTIDLRIYEPGALVPAMEAIPAVSRGSVDGAYSSATNFASIDPAFELFTSVPFGPPIGEYLAWMYYGGGLELSRELFAAHNIHNIPCGLTPPEASGWFNKEINRVEDLDGLKMRFSGLGARVMAKLGVATQLMAGGEIFQALQLGVIDATEFGQPSMDQDFGLYLAAKYYYFPGWHQQASFFQIFINKDKWDSLSDQNQAVVELACGDLLRDMIAEGEGIQFKALAEMRDKHEVEIKQWSPEILSALGTAWEDVVSEISSESENFARVYASYLQFREDYEVWRAIGYLQ